MRQHLKHHRAINTVLLLCDSIFLCDINVPGRYVSPSQAGFEIQTDDYCVICKILLMLTGVGLDKPFSVLARSHTHSHTYTRFILCLMPNWPPFTDTSFHYTTKPTVNSVTQYREQISSGIFWWTMCKKHNCEVFHFCIKSHTSKQNIRLQYRWKVKTVGWTQECEYMNRDRVVSHDWGASQQTERGILALSKGSAAGHTLAGHQVLIGFLNVGNRRHKNIINRFFNSRILVQKVRHLLFVVLILNRISLRDQTWLL